MKAAISTDGEYVSAHFGRCPSFTIVEIENGKVISAEEIPNPGHSTGFLPQFLHENGVECIIAGGMGRRAIDLFEQYRIRPILGLSGKVEDVIGQFLSGTLKSGESLCQPGAGKGYGVEKTDKDPSKHKHNHSQGGE
jgi:predicted Fe-Mo cluster-binding NifX family protein